MSVRVCVVCVCEKSREMNVPHDQADIVWAELESAFTLILAVSLHFLDLRKINPPLPCFHLVSVTKKQGEEKGAK